MAQRPTKLQKASPKRREDEKKSDWEEGGQYASVGENAAPDTPEHVMPSPQANGGGFVSDESNKDYTPEDKLTPTELAGSGYPNPEETPAEGVNSMREGETGVEHAQRQIELAHDMFEVKLHSIQDNAATRERMLADGEDVDYANLPNAPKGSNVLVLGPDEPLRVSGHENGGVIVLDKTVYRAHRPFRSLRWTFTLEYPFGAEVPVSKVRTVPVPEGKEPSSTEETKLQKENEQQ